MKDYWTRTDYENGLINDVGMIGLPVFPDPPVIEADPAPNDTTTSDDEAEADDGAEFVDFTKDDVFERELAAYHRDRDGYAVKKAALLRPLWEEQQRRAAAAEAQAAQKASADAAALMAQDYDAQLMARVAMLFRLHVPAERYEAFLADAGLTFEDLRANCLASLISRDPEEVALSQRILGLLQEQDALQAQESPLPTIDAGQAEALQQQIEDLKRRLGDYRN